jgi:uncharacterized membrane protein (UPF0127 family)
MTTSSISVALALVVVAVWPSADAAECPRWRAAFLRMPTRVVAIETGSRTLRLSAKAAEDDEQRAAGFQCASRAEIERTQILFDFGNEITTAFHMQNVAAPLDIAFAKGDGRIFSVQRMMPSPTALYQPLGTFRYALEARAGFFEQQGIRAGEARLLLAQ